MKECVLCSRHTDEVVLYIHDNWRVLLVDDADYPGFCRVVWSDHVSEMTDLSPTDRAELMQVVWLVEETIRKVMQPDKINLASLGNMVPHLHWHIIPRYANDRNFPDSVWSAAKRKPDEKDRLIRKDRISELKKNLSVILERQYGLSRKP